MRCFRRTTGKENTITKGIVIAGTRSGAGKTTITLGIMAALRRRGVKVAPFKVGPDFIDPGHHAHAAGSASRNLDGWMLDRPYNGRSFSGQASRADVAVVEGVMGLFDGFCGSSEEGSTAQMAKWLHLPVVLVVDAASMARSAAALVQGFERFDRQVPFAGVVFNNLGSPGHLQYLKDAMAAYVDMPLLGGLLRNDQLRMPERHLGLVTADDRPLSQVRLDALAAQIETGIDLDALLRRLPEINFDKILSTGRPAMDSAQGPVAKDSAAITVRLGVARDRAFCFYYPDNLELLSAAGIEIVPFSPVDDGSLPEDLDGLYFGGGYPELHAKRLAANRELREAIRRCSRLGMPIYGECGGFMYLCRDLEDRQGKIHPMCGCFPFRTRMGAHLRTLGYREVRLSRDTILGRQTDILRGHEFHYSELAGDSAPSRADTAYDVRARKGGRPGREGYLVRQTLGSYIHLHFGSRPQCVHAMADACRRYQQTRSSGHETP